MRWAWLPQFFFVLYCIEAGVFLVMAPWSGAWEGLMAHFPVWNLHRLLLTPAGRGAITGFGLIHLVWGAHDLESWLARKRSDGGLRS